MDFDRAVLSGRLALGVFEPSWLDRRDRPVEPLPLPRKPSLVKGLRG
jgi:hypothetical protein